MTYDEFCNAFVEQICIGLGTPVEIIEKPFRPSFSASKAFLKAYLKYEKERKICKKNV